MRLPRLLDDERVRYLLVGGWNTVFGYGLFLALLAILGKPVHSLATSSLPLAALIGFNYYVAISWIGWIVAVPQSTITMKYLAFRSQGKLLPQIGRAFFVYLPAQGLGSAILWVTVQLLHFSPPVGGLITIATTTIFSYFGHKYFTFGAKHVIEVEAAGGVFEDERGAGE
jgi:putative flippase GtrA